MERELDELKESLVRGLRVDLGPGDGDEAFDRHLLLAARIHRAAGLGQTGKGEGKGRVQFFGSFFPDERKSPEDADLLWRKWRVGLLKDGTPLDGVAITHGQPALHWQTDMHGALCINLESMWDDFEFAVEKLVDALRLDPKRRTIVLRRWRERTWTVRPFTLMRSTPIRATGQSSVTAYLPVGSTMAVTGASPTDQTAK